MIASLQRDVAEVAPALLGWHLCRRFTDGLIARARIVETEAYSAEDDPASHAFRGPTPRNRAMFGEVGRAYVYFIYGMHHCVNVVAHLPGRAGAVLLRALQPLEGVTRMLELRGPRAPRELCNGPGKLCQALGIDRSCNDLDLGNPAGALWLEPGEAVQHIRCGPRIGIRLGTDTLWRFWEGGNSYVSRPFS